MYNSECFKSEAKFEKTALTHEQQAEAKTADNFRHVLAHFAHVELLCR